jgi:hypothetical protein
LTIGGHMDTYTLVLQVLLEKVYGDLLVMLLFVDFKRFHFALFLPNDLCRRRFISILLVCRPIRYGLDRDVLLRLEQ